jgi:hypothetical protein
MYIVFVCRYVRQLSGALTMETGLPSGTLEYLRTRISGLSDREKLTSIILDEVYSAKRIEYSNGKFYGFENSLVTKTLLCFMVKSVAGKYEDVVAMVPLTTISSEIIARWYDRVLKAVTELGFVVVVTLTDAHSSNRKFFTKELCNGTIQTHFINPYSGSPIFLAFDSVHVFKNLYNNLLNRREFQCPPFEGLPISAKFKHVEALYKAEMGRAIKYAYKLTDKVLAPQPIERTRVQLADAFFDDSTINGLEQICQEEDWKETARFLRLVRRFWNCVNVQSKFAAKHKRDDRRLVITAEDRTQLDFLDSFTCWLSEWQNMSGKTALSRETFLAIQQTTPALRELTIYLLDEKNLDYVLLGKINSDPLERRFGWYRQLAGANYYISVRQFLEAEKKIRLKCLVKFQGLKLSDVAEVFQEGDEAEKNKVQDEADNLYALLPLDNLSCDFQLHKGEEGILYYVSGYIARSILKRTKCDNCHELLIKSMEPPEIEIGQEEEEEKEEDRQAKEAFLRSVDRGGLVTPSELVYLVCVHAIQLKEELFDNGKLQKKFLASANPRSVFASILKMKIECSTETVELLNQTCNSAHEFLKFVPTIAIKIFNCLSKNFISKLNDEIHAARKRGGGGASDGSKPTPAQRKIAKLQSN